MVGMIPKVLINWVRERGGDKAVSGLKKQAGVPQELEFRLNDVYDDAIVLKLFAVTQKVFHLTEQEFYNGYAEAFMSDAMQRFRHWREMAPNARSFLERQPVIHNGFATAVQDPEARKAIRDKFRLEKRENEIVTHYHSPNKLCGLYKSLAHWVLDHYNETAAIEETHCQKNGDPECIIHIRWPQEENQNG